MNGIDLKTALKFVRNGMVIPNDMVPEIVKAYDAALKDSAMKGEALGIWVAFHNSRSKAESGGKFQECNCPRCRIARKALSPNSASEWLEKRDSKHNEDMREAHCVLRGFIGILEEKCDECKDEGALCVGHTDALRDWYMAAKGVVPPATTQDPKPSESQTGEK